MLSLLTFLIVTLAVFLHMMSCPITADHAHFRNGVFMSAVEGWLSLPYLFCIGYVMLFFKCLLYHQRTRSLTIKMQQKKQLPMVSVYTRSPATRHSQCMTSIDARRVTRPSATPFVSIALKPAMLDMKWSSLGMTGMLKVSLIHISLLPIGSFDAGYFPTQQRNYSHKT